jgi:hypothetical protein
MAFTVAVAELANGVIRLWVGVEFFLLFPRFMDCLDVCGKRKGIEALGLRGLVYSNSSDAGDSPQLETGLNGDLQVIKIGFKVCDVTS